MTDEEALRELQKALSYERRNWGWETKVQALMIRHFYGDVESMAKYHMGLLLMRLNAKGNQ